MALWLHTKANLNQSRTGPGDPARLEHETLPFQYISSVQSLPPESPNNKHFALDSKQKRWSVPHSLGKHTDEAIPKRDCLLNRCFAVGWGRLDPTQTSATLGARTETPNQRDPQSRPISAGIAVSDPDQL